MISTFAMSVLAGVVANYIYNWIEQRRKRK